MIIKTSNADYRMIAREILSESETLDLEAKINRWLETSKDNRRGRGRVSPTRGPLLRQRLGFQPDKSVTL